MSEARGREDLAPPALAVVDVAKAYGEVRALDGVSFEVGGGVFGLLGANGAGKSTLFQAILHLVDLDAGAITVAGIDVRTRSVEARRLIGYLPEEPQLYARLTGDELLRFVAGIKGLDNAAERVELLDYFGIADQADQLISGYSLGMRKKIALITALMGSPRLVLLDEPLNGLDTENMRRLRIRIETMAAAGSTFVISSHAMAFVERVCDRMAILRDGRLVALGDADALRAQAGPQAQAGQPITPFEDVFLRLAVDPAD